MKDTPINYEIVSQQIREMKLPIVGNGSIREIKRLIDNIEKASGERFVRMEMGVPGLEPCSIGVEAEIEALRKGCAAIYPDIDGTPELKKEISRFVKMFLDIDVAPTGCIPTVGSMTLLFTCWKRFRLSVEAIKNISVTLRNTISSANCRRNGKNRRR